MRGNPFIFRRVPLIYFPPQLGSSVGILKVTLDALQIYETNFEIWIEMEKSTFMKYVQVQRPIDTNKIIDIFGGNLRKVS
jgi:hypothetical protein